MEIKKKTKTDEAWERLYARFEKDNLLAETKKRKPRRYILGWGAVAAAMIVGVVFALTLWRTSPSDVDTRKFVTQENQEAATLVKTLEDGSVVYLAQASTLQYPEHFDTDRREVNLQGEAFFDVAKRPEQTFLIDTEKVRVEVLGTAFDVRSNEKNPFSLSVLRGKVKVSLKQGNQTLYVGAGETVILQNDGLQISTTKYSGHFDRYTKNIRFKDECLEDVLRVVNMESSGRQIETLSPALGKKRLTVEFSDNSPESVAELICWTFNLKCTREGDKLILSE